MHPETWSGIGISIKLTYHLSKTETNAAANMLLIKSKTPSDRLQQVSWLEAMFITYARKQECFIMSISQDGQGPQSKDGIWLFPWHWQFSILNWISTSRFDPPKKPPGMTQNLLTHWLCNDCTCLWHCLASSRALSISNLFSKKSAARDPSACGQQVGLQILQDSISSLSLMVSMSWTSQDTL